MITTHLTITKSHDILKMLTHFTIFSDCRYNKFNNYRPLRGLYSPYASSTFVEIPPFAFYTI